MKEEEELEKPSQEFRSVLVAAPEIAKGSKKRGQGENEEHGFQIEHPGVNGKD